MAQTTNRKINIWVNGTEVENSVKKIKAEISQTTAIMNKAKIGSKEYFESIAKLKTLNSHLTNHKNHLEKVGTTFKKATPEIRGFSTAFSGLKSIFAGNLFANFASSISSTIMSAFSQMSTSVIEFEKSISNVFTLLSSEDLSKYKTIIEEGSVEIIKEYGFAIEDVNSSLFNAISAGVPAANSIEFMKEAATLAEGGVTDLSVATDGLTTIINAWGLSTSEATNIANAFFSAQKGGKTTVEELANSIGDVASVASNLGVSYQEVLAAQSQITLSGIGTSEATTMLKSALDALSNPSKEAEAALTQLGIPFGATAVKAYGFTETLQLLSQAVKEHPDLMTKAISSQEALSGILALSGEKLQNYESILSNVNTDIGENSSLMRAAALQHETAAASIERAKGSMLALGLQLKDVLAPIISQTADKLGVLSDIKIDTSGDIQKIVKFITELISNSDKLFLTYKDNFKYIFSFFEVISDSLKTLGLFSDSAGMASGIIKILGFTLKLASAPLKILLNILAFGIKLFTKIAEPIVNIATKFAEMVTNIPFVSKVITGLTTAFSWLKDSIKDVLEWLNILNENESTVTAVKTLEESTSGLFGNIKKNVLDFSNGFKSTLEGIVIKTTETNDIIVGDVEDTNDEIEKDTNETYTRLKAIYDEYQIELLNATEELKKASMTDREKEIYEEEVKWAEMITIAEEAIKELEAKGTSLTEQEMVLLKGFYEQKDKLTDAQEKGINAIKEKYNKEEALAKTEAFKAYSEALMTEQEKEINEVTNNYKEKIKIAEEYGWDTIELYEKMFSEINAINEKYAKDNYPFGWDKDKWDNITQQFDNIVEKTNLLKDAFSQYSNYKKAKEEENLAFMETSYDQQQKSLDRMLAAGTISQNTYYSKIAAMERNKEATQKNIAQKQAKRDKAIAIYEGIINTASAVLKTLAEGGALAIPLSIMVGAMGAFQTGLIAAEPIPKFAKGALVERPTMAMVGEEGPEAIFSNRMLTDKNTGPVINDLLKIQSGKMNIPQPRLANFSAMKEVAGKGMAINNNFVNNFKTEKLESKIDELTNENQQIKNSIQEMVTIWKNPNTRIKANISMDDFKRIESDNEFITDFSKI